MLGSVRRVHHAQFPLSASTQGLLLKVRGYPLQKHHLPLRPGVATQDLQSKYPPLFGRWNGWHGSQNYTIWRILAEWANPPISSRLIVELLFSRDRDPYKYNGNYLFIDWSCWKNSSPCHEQNTVFKFQSLQLSLSAERIRLQLTVTGVVLQNPRPGLHSVCFCESQCLQVVTVLAGGKRTVDSHWLLSSATQPCPPGWMAH